MTATRTTTRIYIATAIGLFVLTATACGGDDEQARTTTTTTTAVPASTTAAPATTLPTAATTTVADSVPEPTTSPGRPDPGVLELVDADIQFAPDKFIDTFAIRNAGGEEMRWTAVGVPDSLILKTRSGTLAPGETVGVLVTVKHEALPAGPFVLTFFISANDTAQQVTLSGTKT